MTDLLHAIAEIEGVRLAICAENEYKHDPIDRRCLNCGRTFLQHPLRNPWNPLENWSDCGPLIEKYCVTIDYDDHGPPVAFIRRRYGAWKNYRDPDLKTAIVKAIIARGKP